MKINAMTAAIAALMIISSCGQGNRSASNASSQPLLEADSLETAYAPAIAIGAKVPVFQVSDLEGNPVALSDFEGKYLVIDFWATWCGDCRREIPQMKKLAAEYDGKELDGTVIEFFSLSFDHDSEKWHELVSAEGFTWKQGSNLIKWKENPISEAYGIRWIPTMMIISPDGTLVDYAVTAERLAAKLEALCK